MSTNLNLSAASIGAAESSGRMSVADRVATVVKRGVSNFREMLALRRSLQEISQLSERELLDIGLQQDEIVRLRAAEYFMPRSWQAR